MGLPPHEAHAWGALLSHLHHLPDWPGEYGAGVYYGREEPQVWHAYLAEDRREEVQRRLKSLKTEDRTYSVGLFRRLEKVLERNGIVFLGMICRPATWRPLESVGVPERLRWEWGTCFARDGWTWYMCGPVPRTIRRSISGEQARAAPIVIELEPEPSLTEMVGNLDRRIRRVECKLRCLKRELRMELEAELERGSDNFGD